MANNGRTGEALGAERKKKRENQLIQLVTIVHHAANYASDPVPTGHPAIRAVPTWMKPVTHGTTAHKAARTPKDQTMLIAADNC